MSQSAIRFDSDATPEAFRGARAALAAEGVRTDGVDSCIAVSAAQRQDADQSFTVDEVRQDAEHAVRDLWRQPSPYATTPTNVSAARQDGEQVTPDELRQRSQDDARNAWRK